MCIACLSVVVLTDMIVDTSVLI